MLTKTSCKSKSRPLRPNRRATPALVHALDDTAAPVRIDAVRSLVRLGDPAAVPRLDAFVGDARRSIDERQEALRGLATLARDRRIEILATHAASGDPNLRLVAVELLGQTGDRAAVPILRSRARRERVARIKRMIESAIRRIQSGAPAAIEADGGARLQTG